jgi:HNH endonuclease
MKNKNPDSTFLRECFEYNIHNGQITWKERPRDHFECGRKRLLFNNKRAGTEAAKSMGGRRVVRFLGKYSYYASRVAWCLVTGEYPKRPVVHLNGDREDIRWGNLSLA